MKTVTAPDLTPGYPSAGQRLGPAWNETWARLSETPGEWVDGATLWTEVAPRHELSPYTLRGLMFRMAKGGIIQSAPRQVDTPRGKRTRTAFRMIIKES